MTDIIEAYKIRMQMALDNGPLGNEWDVVNDLLTHPPDELDVILKWILAEHRGYVETRAQAGFKFLERNPVEGLAVIEHLISSNDPDDRDTAVTVLE